MISLDSVGFAYGPGNPVIENLNLAFSANKITAIIGPNGCGKSTILKLSSGLLTPDSGRVFFQQERYCFYEKKGVCQKSGRGHATFAQFGHDG